MPFLGVWHQSLAQRVIREALKTGRMPHAYVFHGPDGVGKELLARGLAQLLLCSNPIEQEAGDDDEAFGGEPVRTACGTCAECCLTLAQTHPDLHLVYRQLNRQHPDPAVRKRKALFIGVDVLRHFVIDRVQRTPTRGRAKVFILREAERMNPQAQNALLKTLEEPPGTTYLILLVSAVDRLLPTTLSRCQIVPFDALPEDFVADQLAARRPDLPTDRGRWYARFSQGSLGTALEQVADDLYEVYGTMASALAGSIGSRSDTIDPSSMNKSWMAVAKRLGECHQKRDPDITETESTRRGLKTVFHMAADWFADVLRVASGGEACSNDESTRSYLSRSGTRVTASDAADAIGRIVQAERQLDLNANVQLCVETLISDLGRIGRGDPINVG